MNFRLLLTFGIFFFHCTLSAQEWNTLKDSIVEIRSSANGEFIISIDTHGGKNLLFESEYGGSYRILGEVWNSKKKFQIRKIKYFFEKKINDKHYLGVFYDTQSLMVLYNLYLLKEDNKKERVNKYFFALEKLAHDIILLDPFTLFFNNRFDPNKNMIWIFDENQKIQKFNAENKPETNPRHRNLKK